jgi:hypothetical protein
VLNLCLDFSSSDFAVDQGSALEVGDGQTILPTRHSPPAQFCVSSCAQLGQSGFDSVLLFEPVCASIVASWIVHSRCSMKCVRGNKKTC